MRTSPYTLAEKRLMLAGASKLTVIMLDLMDKDEIEELWAKMIKDMEELEVEALEKFIPV